MLNLSNCLFALFIPFLSCTNYSGEPQSNSFYNSKAGADLLNEKGNTIERRFNPPNGYERIILDPGSFGYYLRNLPLKPSGSTVKYFDGSSKLPGVYEAVVDMEISKNDLQQCADAVMRLRGEYFYSQHRFDKISFTLTNGFKVDYSEWMKGNRIIVNGNKTSWKKSGPPSNTYKDFREYMEFVFTYAGTLSLSKSLHHKNLNEIEIGDVFIVGGSPGHAVIVVDLAQNKSGKKVFMIAQSYMPAQETQILKNLNDYKLSPWYEADFTEKLMTPQWEFHSDQLMTW